MDHSIDDSVTRWIEDLKQGDAQAPGKLWSRYFDRLVRVAERKLGDSPRRAADEEDVALSAFQSLYSGARAGRFKPLENRDDLWRLLVAICAKKSVDLMRHESCQKRGGGAVRGDSVFRIDQAAGPRDFDEFMSDDPTPEFLLLVNEEHNRLMDQLDDDALRQIAGLRIEGFTAAEIAEQISVSSRTVERKLKQIRNAWSDTIYEGSSSTCIFSRSPLFTGMPMHIVEPHTSKARFPKGSYLMRQGEVGDSLLVIGQGTVDVCVDLETGREVIDQAGPGQVLGEMALLTNEPRSASVIATSDVAALVLPAKSFHRLANEHPELSVVLTNLVSQRLGRAECDALADKVLGGFRIRQRLGKGGMGVVYEAQQLDDGRRVALKMMSHRLVYDREARARFEREADIVSSFDHPNIVKMLSRFPAFHTFFICLEFCDGGSLADLIANHGPLAADQIRRIYGSVASALRYAHERGVCHCDVKPANIMCNADHVKLTDFGLSQMLVDNKDAKGRLLGTLRYMSPEQLAGKPAGRREADYFALGCVAYEMFTGQPLFRAKDATQLLRAHREWSPPSVSDLRPDVPRELCDQVQGCLHKEPRMRMLNFD